MELNQVQPRAWTSADSRCMNSSGYITGPLKIIAVILEAPVIEKILTHLGLQARAPASGRRPVARRCKRPDVAQP